MSCENCQELRDQLRSALLDMKLREAAGIAVTGIKTMVTGDAERTVVKKNRGTASDVPKEG